MKKFLLSLIALLSISSMYAENDYLYIEDFEVSNDRLYTIVPIKAHFDCYVSGFQIELTLPEGLKVSVVDKCEDLYIDHEDEDGFTVTYMPFVGIGHMNTRYIVSSWEMDYYQGNAVGVAKYSPGDYVFFELSIDITMDFKGGEIEVKSICCSGGDTRPWVHRCTGCNVTTTAHVSVDGVEPEPNPDPDPADPHDEGYWLVLGSSGNERYIEMPSNCIYIRLVNGQGESMVPFHFRVDGTNYGAGWNGHPTDFEEIENNPLYMGTKNSYVLDGGKKYLLVVYGPYIDECYLYAHIIYDDGGFDSVNEFVTDKKVESIRYFDINGRELHEPGSGITIVVTTYTDGTSESVKKIIR